MEFAKMTIEDFLGVLKTKEPVPGGGGASALTAGIGAALGNMVGSLTVGKKKYADVEEKMQELMVQSCKLIERFKELMDEDAKAFAPLAAAYSLPKNTEEEIAYKDQVMEAALKDAANAPLSIMQTCCAGIDIVEEFAKYGSRLAVSDAGCAAANLEAGLKAAALNVYINTKAMKNREYAESLNERVDNMLEMFGKKANDIYELVKGGLK